MWQLLAGVCAAAVAALWFLWRPLARWRQLLLAASKLPGPALPRLLLGEDPLAAFTATCRGYGTPCRLWVGPRLYVLLSDPEHARAVLGGAACLERDRRLTGALRPFTGGGLITARAADWNIRRSLVSRVFTPEWMQSQCEWLRRAADRLVVSLRDVYSTVAAGQRDAAVEREVSACALDAVAGSALGLQARATGRPPAGFVHHYLQALHLIRRTVSQPPLQMWGLLALTGRGQQQARLVRQVHGYIDAALDNALHSSTRDQESHIALSWERASDSGDDPDRLPGSALELLLGMSDERQLVREELASLLLAGHEPTAAALCFCLQLLALHQKIQEEAVSDEKLRKRVVLESLRLFPPSPLLTRQLTEDVPLPGTPYVLPAGCTAVVCSLLTHRDPKVWPDPDTFSPDRFLEKECQKRHPFAFLAFGGGHRRCPGSEYARLQLDCALSKLLTAFRVVTGAQREDVEDLRMRTVLSPRKGFQLHLVSRA